MMLTRSRRTKPEGSSEPSERQGGVIVPDTPRSPTCDGPSFSRAAGDEEEMVTASALLSLKQELRLAMPSMNPYRSAEDGFNDRNVIDISDEIVIEDNVNRAEEGNNNDVPQVASAIPTYLKGRVEVQTPGGTSIGDIVLTREQSLQELRFITESMERDLNEITKSCSKKHEQMEKNKTKKPYIKEKKEERDGMRRRGDR